MDSRNTVESRVRTAIEFANELPDIEFKRGETFDTLKYRIVKNALALANLRDGGLVIVGVRQDGGRFIADGVDADVESTYEAEKVYELVNEYASPTIELRVVVVEHDTKRFVAIAVPPFQRTPVVCRRPTPDGVTKNDALRPGDFFVRTGSPVSATRVNTAAMMEDLLQVAAGRRAAETIRMLRAGGLAPETLSVSDPLDGEVEDLADLF